MSRSVHKRSFVRPPCLRCVVVLALLWTGLSAQGARAASSGEEPASDSDAVAQCKQQHGKWRWLRNKPKVSGECIKKVPDAGKPCTDNNECSTHHCLAGDCYVMEECLKAKVGKCFDYTGATYGCDVHFEKGRVYQGLSCKDPEAMFYDSGDVNPPSKK